MTSSLTCLPDFKSSKIPWHSPDAVFCRELDLSGPLRLFSFEPISTSFRVDWPKARQNSRTLIIDSPQIASTVTGPVSFSRQRQERSQRLAVSGKKIPGRAEGCLLTADLADD